MSQIFAYSCQRACCLARVPFWLQIAETTIMQFCQASLWCFAALLNHILDDQGIVGKQASKSLRHVHVGTSNCPLPTLSFDAIRDPPMASQKRWTCITLWQALAEAASQQRLREEAESKMKEARTLTTSRSLLIQPFCCPCGLPKLMLVVVLAHISRPVEISSHLAFLVASARFCCYTQVLWWLQIGYTENGYNVARQCSA